MVEYRNRRNGEPEKDCKSDEDRNNYTNIKQLIKTTLRKEKRKI